MDPRTIARAADAHWLYLPDGEAGWIEVRERGARVRAAGIRPSRRLDFGLLRTVPANRLVRLGPRAIERRPRLCGGEAQEILVYGRGRGGERSAILGTTQSSRIDLHLVEALLRAWFAFDALRADQQVGEEDRRWSRIGREAACVAHDLGHHLTVASLELDRFLANVAPGGEPGLRRAALALSDAGELCRRSAAGAERDACDEPASLLEILRGAARDAAAVGGRAERMGFDVRCPADLEVRTDRLLLLRLVRNLALNALEATPDGQIVEIHARSTAAGETEITVQDRGRGMSAASRAELLRFGRSGSGGSGVGSSSVEGCARRLGVELHYQSRLGTGTRVEFRLRSARAGA